MSDPPQDFDLRRAAEESPFSRDVDGFLVRLDPPTAADYDADITLTIDGKSVTVKKAVPLKDGYGHNVYRDGRTVPRATTIYDAACQCGVDIPVLCHQPHQRPAAVCRVCSVLVKRPTDRYPPSKLVPACQHRVESGMEVNTRKSSEQVERVVKTLIELLHSDNRSDAHRVDNEVVKLARAFGVTSQRFAEPGRTQPTDKSSPVIEVDHSACILCDRCIRGCNEVRGNFVIGRTGKGYTARIGFDLGGPMGESSCVECGECMVSCPTGALTARVEVVPPPREAPGEVLRPPVSADELLRPPLATLFKGIPRKFLEWNAGAVYRRRLNPGDVVIREGEYGSHAFLLLSGTLTAEIKSPQMHIENARPKRAISRMLGQSMMERMSRAEQHLDNPHHPRSLRTDLGISIPSRSDATIITAARGHQEPQLIGESACLNNYPYGSTVTAVEPSVILEIRRNLLLHMMRNPATRKSLSDAMQSDALAAYRVLHPLLATLGLTPQEQVGGRGTLTLAETQRLARDLAYQIEFVRIDPGQPVFSQGDVPDHCYLVRIGFIRVSQTRGTQEIVLDYVGPGGVIGIEELLQDLKGQTARRTYNCRALDHVELIRIPGQAFRMLMKGDRRVQTALEEAADELTCHLAERQVAPEVLLDTFLEQGLFNARNLLVLDLNKCTRCDECTRACADTHDGVTRLLREGLRFQNFLVTTSCRSCLDPTCLVGCPVDAIHRKGNSREIEIEDWCIGCGVCAKSCPYGNIHMAETSTDKRAEPAFKATTCDLCQSLRPNSDPSCVFACPHDAAHRMHGQALYQLTTGNKPGKGAALVGDR